MDPDSESPGRLLTRDCYAGGLSLPTSGTTAISYAGTQLGSQYGSQLLRVPSQSRLEHETMVSRPATMHAIIANRSPTVHLRYLICSDSTMVSIEDCKGSPCDFP